MIILIPGLGALELVEFYANVGNEDPKMLGVVTDSLPLKPKGL